MERAWLSRLHKVLAVGLWFLSLSMIAAHSDEPAKSDRLTQTDGRETIVAKTAEQQPVERIAMSEATTTAVLLQLEAFINGVSTSLIGSFRLNHDGSLSIAADELRDLGLIPDPQALSSDGMIHLNRLPNVIYKYDEAAQAIRFTAGDRQRIAHRIATEGGAGDLGEIERGFGALVNYTLTANFDSANYWHLPNYSGVFGYFDGRLFTSYGTLDNSFSARSAPYQGEYVTRLDTAWRYSDPQSMRTYIAGDFISSGLAWTRPVRMGGMQVRRNFGLRPDLVTMPVPELSGSAAVPSAVDIYVNGVKTYSNHVPSGPFVVDDLPVITGPGVARVVVRDTTTGQQTQTEVDFYASSLLLRPGLADYSFEAGFARTDYGIESESYDGDIIGSASLRYGFTDSLTLEGHSEGGAGLLNAGGGLTLGLGGWGVGSIAGAASNFNDEDGFLVSASLEAAVSAGWRFFVRSQRTFGEYNDLASVTADRPDNDHPFFSLRPPEALDQISLSVPLYFDESSLNLSLTHVEDDDDESTVMSLSYNRSFVFDSTFFATAYADLDHSDDFGIYAGIAVQFGGNITGAAGVEHGDRHTNAFVEVVRPDQDEEGSVGWRLRAGAGEKVNSRAAVSYVGRYARLEAGAQQYGNTANFVANMSGAVVAADGDVFLSRRVDDSFAIVDVGAPDVEVTAANRLVGKSGRSGKVIVSRLNSYERNRIAIDPKNLPVDADIPQTSRIVVPADKTGVVVAFNTRMDGRSALIHFVDAGNRPLQPGLAGRVEASGAEFIVGYDGEAYLTDLADVNVAEIELADGAHCRAQFSFQKAPGEQQLISGVICQ